RFHKPRWGDKTPYYAGHMHLIQSLLPEARFIHLIRDGRDVGLSVKDLWFGPNSLVEAAHWWAAGIQRARQQAGDLRYYLEIQYEDLVARPESTLQRVCAFLDLPWHPGMLDCHQTATERIGELQAISPDDGREVSAEKRRDIHHLT